LPAFTCVATLHPVEAIGARPVLVDIETETFSMDPAKAIEAVTARTRASIGLEQLRRLPEMLALRREIASRYNESLAELDWMRTPQVPPGFTHAYQSYVCLLRHEVFQGRVERSLLRVRLCKHLASRGHRTPNPGPCAAQARRGAQSEQETNQGNRVRLARVPP